MIDPRPLWDFDDPAASGERFLDVAEHAHEPDKTAWLTQYARTLGLQERYDDAHKVLDRLASEDPQAATYLDLERGWRVDIDPFSVDDEPICPGCHRPGHDVWPCHECGLMMHSSCGYGMRRKKIAKPYRTRDMGSESVIAEWLCERCASVVGLDVDRGDERGRAQ